MYCILYAGWRSVVRDRDDNEGKSIAKSSNPAPSQPGLTLVRTMIVILVNGQDEEILALDLLGHSSTPLPQSSTCAAPELSTSRCCRHSHPNHNP